MRYLLTALLVVFCVPAISFAAELTFEQVPSTIQAGDTFSAHVVLNTGLSSINAVEGSVQIPSGMSLVDIRLDGSLVPLWVSPPTVKGDIVAFAGVLPGGYQGTGDMFTLVLKAEGKGTDTLTFGPDTALYQNDGSGSAAKLETPDLPVVVKAATGTPKVAPVEKDTLPPEPFAPTIVSGDSFGLQGDVLVFTSQDKASILDKFEISKSFNKSASPNDLVWSPVKSPYQIGSGDTGQYLFIRATDASGNSRIVVVSPRGFSPLAFFINEWPYILLGVFVVILLIQFRRRR